MPLSSMCFWFVAEKGLDRLVWLMKTSGSALIPARNGLTSQASACSWTGGLRNIPHQVSRSGLFPCFQGISLDSNKRRTFTQEKWWPWWSSQHSYTVQVGCIWGLWWLMVLQRPRGFGDGGFDLCRGEWISGSAVTDCLPGATLKCLRWPSPAPESHRTLCTWGWTTVKCVCVYCACIQKQPIDAPYLSERQWQITRIHLDTLHHAFPLPSSVAS